MKYMNMLKKYWSMELQLFAGEDDPGDNGSEEDPENDSENEKDTEDNPDEKKFSQKDVDEAIRKRLARERRKWQREQQSKTSGNVTDGTGKAGEDSEEEKEKTEAITKASKLEVKVACYEADVAKDAVDDVAALARAYMDADDSLDLEDAIEKVVKKYPHFKKSGTTDPESEDPNKGKSWGERQKGGGQKLSGVEAAFLKKNPGLKY
nr:MAG TPA: Major capsid protein [Caudoviricetes sp.]